MKSLKQTVCKHEWEYINGFVIWDIQLKESCSDIHRGWFSEVVSFMESIGADDILPIHTKECRKCGKQGQIAIDTLIEATFSMYITDEVIEG